MVGDGAFGVPFKAKRGKENLQLWVCKSRNVIDLPFVYRDVEAGVPRNAQSKFWGFSCAPTPTIFTEPVMKSFEGFKRALFQKCPFVVFGATPQGLWVCVDNIA